MPPEKMSNPKPHTVHRHARPFRGFCSAVLVLPLLMAGACQGPLSTADPDLAQSNADDNSLETILDRSDLPPELKKAVHDDPMGTTVHRLENGLTVYISTDRQVPRVTAHIAVRAGSRNDPATSTGLAPGYCTMTCAWRIVNSGSSKRGIPW